MGCLVMGSLVMGSLVMGLFVCESSIYRYRWGLTIQYLQCKICRLMMIDDLHLFGFILYLNIKELRFSKNVVHTVTVEGITKDLLLVIFLFCFALSIRSPVSRYLSPQIRLNFLSSFDIGHMYLWPEHIFTDMMKM